MRLDEPLAGLVPAADLSAWAAGQRAQGRSIVMTNGVYDLIHDGHLKSLVAAAEQGDVLLVAVNSDRSVGELKGPDRPVLGEAARSDLLRALRVVDAVTIFDDLSVLPTILQVRPEVIAKGGQYTEDEIVGSQEAAGWGGRAVRLPMVDSVSTTELLRRIRAKS
ncbi:D-glycero-beta-D-manno-heptose 1-phosphate adenylyltransferase [bacterium]|nr:MAG: D-glycero-beta-D-manno-heptose 1-phosphate adenylyltransferase [bacterium]RKZ16386.1 MAG: D-glycero-beta-D-manno-heptose 1-phosphate adenylyltransferase [bacterium]